MIKFLVGTQDYEMTFNAKMNLAKSAIQTGINVTKSKEVLKKMLKDDKNKEYLAKSGCEILPISKKRYEFFSKLNLT